MGMQPFPGLLEPKSKSYLNSSRTEAAASSLHHFNSNSFKLHLHKHHHSHKLGL